jgi:hypothetical protein
MRRFVLPAVLSSAAALCQTPTAPPPGSKAIEIIEIKPDTPIATVNGRKFTAGEFEMLVPNLSPALRELAATNPKEFLEQYALGLNLQAEAEKLKLQDVWPYRQKLADSRRQILAEAVIAEKAKAVKIDPEEIRKIYESRLAGYKQAATKVIFVSRLGYEADVGGAPKQTTTPEQAKAKMDKVVKEVRGGRDFVEAARQYSDDVDTVAKDGDFPYPIRANSTNVPPPIREAVTAAKVGDIVGPVEHNAGWYLFRIESTGVATLEEVKPEIEKELRDAAVRQFVEENRKKSVATLDHEAFWNTFLAANKEAQERRERQGQGK